MHLPELKPIVLCARLRPDGITSLSVGDALAIAVIYQALVSIADRRCEITQYQNTPMYIRKCKKVNLSDYRGQMAEARGQTTEDRKQRTEDRKQRLDTRIQRSGL